MKSYLERFLEFIKSRIFIMMAGIFVLFFAVVCKLFYLQIIHGEEYQQSLTASIMQDLTIPASRGMIYDRYGRPLATNQVAYSLKLDDSITVSFSEEERARMIVELVQDYAQTPGALVDTLPITTSAPYAFTFSSEEEQEAWLLEQGADRKMKKWTAEEWLNYLKTNLMTATETAQALSESEMRQAISLSLSLSDKNLMLLSLIHLLEENGETLSDELPISTSQPYTFLYDGNETKELDWKESVEMEDEELSYDATASMNYLYDLFDIPPCLSEPIKRDMATIRYSLYLNRWRKYEPVTVALNINSQTIAAVEENNENYPGVNIDTSSLRTYPGGKYFSHILGYIRKIDDNEYSRLKEYGYTTSDIVGKSGIESIFELELNGEDGEMLVEVDSSGRRIRTIETIAPISGDNVFLTIDKNLQIAAYEYLEDALTDVLISKLQATSLKDMPITLKEFFASLVNCGTISLPQLLSATDGVQKTAGDLIRAQYPSFSLSDEDALENGKEVLINAINNNLLSSREMIELLVEQGKITPSEEDLSSLRAGSLSPLSVVIRMLEEGQLTPADTDLDPCSGSVVINDVHTGEYLALVTYPSYDNNRLVNTFDNDYYNFLLQHPSTPLVNRPLSQKKAPGSTLKMAIAMAGLETGAISPSTIIYDEGTFTKAGTPYAKCWIATSGGSHQNVDVRKALEVSCNYFFYELAYRMGNQTEGTTEKSIATLDEYMAMFGLDRPTGIEIGESEPNMASPLYKEQTIKWQNPEATTSQTRWTDGDTIRAAIGQSVNNFSPAHMNRYISTLANGGTLYQETIVSKVETADGATVLDEEPVVQNQANFDPENLQAVYDGMLQVTTGTQGTLRTVFQDFPIAVAAKSGTAQESLTRSSHTWFVGFAPYDDPLIAVTVMVPFGETSPSPAAIVGKNIIAEYMGLNYTPQNSYLDTRLAQ